MNKIPNRVLLDNSVVRKVKGAYKDTRIDLLDWVNKQIALSNINIPSGGGGGSTEVINVLADPTVAGDGATDDTAAINAIIAANSGKILYFPKANYRAHITVNVDTHIVCALGAIIFWNSTADPTLTITSGTYCLLEGAPYINSTHASGTGLDNEGFLSCSNANFRGFHHNTSGTTNGVNCHFTDCIFIIHTATAGDIGTACWSDSAQYHDCTFKGTIGADVQDSRFFNCKFGEDEGGNDWGVHMPLGAIALGGGASGYDGTAEFYNCEIFAGDNAVTQTYAMGLGNDAHPSLFNCTVVGNAYGMYVRSDSTIKTENCYFRAKNTSGGAVSVGFFKYQPGGGWDTGTDGNGDSTIKGGTIVSGEHSILVPEDTGLGSLTLDSVSLEWDKIIPGDAAGTPGIHNDAFNYITSVVATPDTLFQSMSADAGNYLISPPYTPAGSMFVEIQSSVAGTRDVRLTKYYRSPTGTYKNGTILVLRGTSDTNMVNVKNGYWAPETTLTVNSSNDDNILGNGDVAVYIYFTNTWIELTNYNFTQYIKVGTGGNIELQPGSRIQLDRTSTIPSPATDVLYLDDGTNHGLGGTPTLMFHNGVGWNALF